MNISLQQCAMTGILRIMWVYHSGQTADNECSVQRRLRHIQRSMLSASDLSTELMFSSSDAPALSAEFMIGAVSWQTEMKMAYRAKAFTRLLQKRTSSKQ